MALAIFAWALAGSVAWAGVAEIGAMRLDYAEIWQRASPAEEAEDDSIILRHAGPADTLTVFLPRRAVPLKIGSAQFYDQLERKWRAQYGKAASIASVVANGRDWRLCVRPSLERPATVFHLVTVEAGRAHHLLAVGKGDAAHLPKELTALLNGIDWPGAAPTIVAAAPPTATAPETSANVVASPPAEVAPAQATAPIPQSATAQVTPPTAEAAQASAPLTVAALAAPAGSQPAAPTATSPVAASAWQLLRAGRQAATGKALARLAAESARRIGDAGMLLGYGLSPREHGLDWFMDGYQFDPYVPGRAGRKAFAQNWALAWQVPASWDGGPALRIPVTFTGSATPAESDAQAGLHAELSLLCGARIAVVRALDAIDRGQADAAAQLAALAQACPEGSAVKGRADVLVAATGQADGSEFRLERSLSLTHGLTVLSAPPEGQVRRILVSLRGIASTPGDAPGDSLLSGALAYYVYGPANPKQP